MLSPWKPASSEDCKQQLCSKQGGFGSAVIASVSLALHQQQGEHQQDSSAWRNFSREQCICRMAWNLAFIFCLNGVLVRLEFESAACRNDDMKAGSMRCNHICSKLSPSSSSRLLQMDVFYPASYLSARRWHLILCKQSITVKPWQGPAQDMPSLCMQLAELHQLQQLHFLTHRDDSLCTVTLCITTLCRALATGCC